MNTRICRGGYQPPDGRQFRHWRAGTFASAAGGGYSEQKGVAAVREVRALRMRAYRLPVRGRIKAIGERASHAMTELLIQQADSRPYAGRHVYCIGCTVVPSAASRMGRGANDL